MTGGYRGGAPMGMNKGWMSLASHSLGSVMPMNVSGGVHQSPASSIGQEDDHSQRLSVHPPSLMLMSRLDHWLSNNTSLSMGSMNGFAPPLESMNFGFTPGPSMPNPGPSLNPVPFTGGFPATPAGMAMNPNSWNDDMTSVPNGGPTSVNTDFNTMQGLNSIGSGMDGMSMGMSTGSMGNVTNISGTEGENSDEYWNALIDGTYIGRLSARLSSLTERHTRYDGGRIGFGPNWPRAKLSSYNNSNRTFVYVERVKKTRRKCSRDASRQRSNWTKLPIHACQSMFGAQVVI